MKKILIKLNIFLFTFILFFAGTVIIGRSIKSDSNSSNTSHNATSEHLTDATSTSLSTEENADDLTSQINLEDPLTTEMETSNETQNDNNTPTDSDIDSSLAQMPEELSSALNQAGYDSTTLDNANCQQLILVSSYGSNASVFFYAKDSDGIWYNTGLDTYGYVGSNGVSHDSYEGSYMTPAGLYSIGDAFYIEDCPNTNLNTFEITPNTYWVDDPDSVYYNQRVELEGEPEWNSAEHMISFYDAYYYGFVINFNMDPIIPGKGSAIFFHVGENPTAGCVAVPQNMMLQYLQELDASQNPYILIN